jgi:hypothetical protein
MTTTANTLAIAIAAERAALEGGATAAEAKAVARAAFEVEAAAEVAARQVAASLIRRDGAAYRVSTVRLPYSSDYETMVFAEGSSRDLYCDRYETEAAARAGHEKAVREFWPVKKTSPAPVEF